jgi:hypothetical protein
MTERSAHLEFNLRLRVDLRKTCHVFQILIVLDQKNIFDVSDI